MIIREVADGISLISHAHVNCYLVEDDDGVTLVDAGLPSMWSMVLAALGRRGRRTDEVRALVLTHGHFDHVGFAVRARREWGVPVLVHPGDERLAAHPYRYTPQRNRLLYPLSHPRSLPVLGRMAAAGALGVKGVEDTESLEAGSTLAVPGRPVVVHTPGHTDGHCILHLPERGAVISGDALVTLDPYTGRPGPQIVASAATKDTRQSLASLDAVAATGAGTVLPGHGDPWTGGAQAAVEQALRVGEH
ncbi:MBL fold metallo-hydrolase [Nocardiopsis algeriensis]|uniref:Glyoxylase-like metal-dependent hydrolase (Beta-lactamase superfamily II) n=1 Tax=Nocardiopsis algeriensis TaxID=1478215 RepID=A0A841IRN7_9ACTN|nr:glyoxylase-like metal-dependent hydrolase (beta-lactamase superfamily II) [Nocardiopsis algeriensis]